MSQLLKDKVAFITGSASGIGHEIAKKFANEGARVVISDMNAEKCAETVFALQKEGFDALSAPCDVTDEEAYRAAIELTQKTYGRLDILINNAGFQHVAVIEDFPTAVYQKLINAFRNLYEHHLILRIEDQDVAAVEAFLESYFDHHETGDYFLCDEDEGRKAFLHRFAVAGAAIRYRDTHRSEVEDIVALDIALRRNDREWVETLPKEMDEQILHKLYYGHFLCHVFHQDYIVKKNVDPLAMEHAMWRLLDNRGAEYPAEHNVGHLYVAKPALKNHYKKLDPTNTFNVGIGQTSKLKYWK